MYREQSKNKAGSQSQREILHLKILVELLMTPETTTAGLYRQAMEPLELAWSSYQASH
jgi:hypothetical protein